ncbi:MAG: aconitase X catalytic domain-containing protein [Anaerolineae bacterium]|nr:aconitase X catalytic domain-containing protein [Anaerolineae bacterium]
MSETELYLTPEETAMLNGEQGPAIRRAIEIVVALAKIYGARSLVPVASVQVSGVSYKNLGEAGLAFLREWADGGARVRVPTTLNPAGMDIARWRALGFSETFAAQQQRVLDAYQAMGIHPTCTCTPYLTGVVPRYGQHIAWAESSAVSFANSVLGARTNREGGPSALAAAIVGRTGAYGLHLDEARVAHYRVDVRCPLRSVSDWGVLGYVVGRQVRNAVPYFFLHQVDASVPDLDALDRDPMVDRLKALGAALAASGAVALNHIHQVTPEARQSSMLGAHPVRITVDSLSVGYQALNTAGGKVDLVSIGCPHASPGEIAQIATAIAGRHLRIPLWVTTARATMERVPDQVAAIEGAGGHVVADTCMVVAPVQDLGFTTLATNSAKMATYAPSHAGVQVRIGTLEQCIQAAVTGTWAPDAERS